MEEDHEGNSSPSTPASLAHTSPAFVPLHGSHFLTHGYLCDAGLGKWELLRNEKGHTIQNIDLFFLIWLGLSKEQPIFYLTRKVMLIKSMSASENISVNVNGIILLKQHMCNLYFQTV